MTEKIQVPQHMLQQLLRGPTPAQKPPDVVEVISGRGGRLCFNLDAVEGVKEDTSGMACYLKLKGLEELIPIDMTYDKFLLAAKIHPRQLHAETDSGD